MLLCNDSQCGPRLLHAFIYTHHPTAACPVGVSGRVETSKTHPQQAACFKTAVNIQSIHKQILHHQPQGCRAKTQCWSELCSSARRKSACCAASASCWRSRPWRSRSRNRRMLERECRGARRRSGLASRSRRAPPATDL